MKRLSLVAVAVTLGVMGCAHAPPQPLGRAALTCPERGGGKWIELQSAHFTLRTDLPKRAARKALAEFEQSHAAFEQLAFPQLVPPRGRIDVLLFNREEDFAALAPPGASGYFLPRQPAELEYTPQVVLHGELSPTSKRRFQHELAHRFLGHHIRSAPPWLEEGLAEYYSTMKLEWGEAVLGFLPLQKLFQTEVKTQGCLHRQNEDNRVQYGDVPSLDELLAADAERFHTEGRETAYYAASWALVHMFNHGPLRERFVAYMNALAAGRGAELSWHEHFGDVDKQALAAEFARYIQKPAEVDERALRYRLAKAAPATSERAMSDGEVHLLWARTRPWDSRERIVRAGEDLRLAATELPDSPEMLYWMSLYHQRWRRFEAAEADLRQALLRQPDEPRLLLSLAALLYDVAGEREPPQPGEKRGAERAEPVVRRLAGRAASPQALNFLARYYTDQGQLERGLPYARRAVSLDPGCWECHDTYAWMLKEKGLSPEVENPATPRLTAPRLRVPVAADPGGKILRTVWLIDTAD